MTRPHEVIHVIPLGSTGHTPSRDCHCGPSASYTDLATGATVWRHRSPPPTSTPRGEALAAAMDRHHHDAGVARGVAPGDVGDEPPPPRHHGIDPALALTFRDWREIPDDEEIR